MNFVIVSHEKSHVKDGFDCGIAELNQYLFRQAGQDVRKYYAALFVAIESATNKVIGYYTLLYDEWHLYISRQDLEASFFRSKEGSK